MSDNEDMQYQSTDENLFDNITELEYLFTNLRGILEESVTHMDDQIAHAQEGTIRPVTQKATDIKSTPPLAG